MPLFRRPPLLIAGLFIGLSAVPLSGWDDEVHVAVAMVAEGRLSAGARGTVTTLLNGQRMADVAMWPDEVRNTTHRRTYNWHFVNIPIDSQGYDPRRDCQPAERGDCMIAALERLERDLANPSLVTDARRTALMFFIHLMADLHQPLHVSNDNDRGGNGQGVADIGGTVNLHSAWDVGILRASGKTTADLVADATRALREREPASDVTRGTYADWAMEGFRLAQTIVYTQVERDGRISDAERQAALGVISEQIRRASVRLAAVLERALGSAGR